MAKLHHLNADMTTPCGYSVTRLRSGKLFDHHMHHYVCEAGDRPVTCNRCLESLAIDEADRRTKGGQPRFRAQKVHYGKHETASWVRTPCGKQGLIRGPGRYRTTEGDLFDATINEAEITCERCRIFVDKVAQMR